MAKEGRSEEVVQAIRRKTRRRFSAEEKIRIMLDGLRGEESIATLCRKEGLAPNLYSRWSKSIRSFTDVHREALYIEVCKSLSNNYLLPILAP